MTANSEARKREEERKAQLRRDKFVEALGADATPVPVSGMFEALQHYQRRQVEIHKENNAAT